MNTALLIYRSSFVIFVNCKLSTSNKINLEVSIGMFVLLPLFSAAIVNSAKKTLTLNCETLNDSTQMLMKKLCFPITLLVGVLKLPIFVTFLEIVCTSAEAMTAKQKSKIYPQAYYTPGFILTMSFSSVF